MSIPGPDEKFIDVDAEVERVMALLHSGRASLKNNDAEACLNALVEAAKIAKRLPTKTLEDIAKRSLDD